MKYKNFQKIKKNSRGFVILFAVTLSSILLAMALGVADIALKEVKFSTNARDTNDAFFAADSGIESVLFADKPPASLTSGTFYVFGLGSTGTSCAIISVVKTAPPVRTTIVSKGYSIGESPTCSSTNQNRIERELRVTY